MSRIRVIRPKKVIANPRPIKRGSKLKHGNTQIKDFSVFNDLTKKLFKQNIKAGTIEITDEKIDVDYLISENVGFKKSGNGRLEIITKEKITSDDSSKIKMIGEKYNVYSIVHALEKKGYRITEKEKDDSEIFIGTLEENEEEQIIISNKDKADIKNENGHSDIKIESKNFADSKSCKKAIEIVQNEIEGDVIYEHDTKEFSVESIKRSRRKNVKKKKYVSNLSGSKRKHSRK